MHIYQSEVMICLITFWHLLVHLLIEQEFCLLCFRRVGPSIWVLHKHHPFLIMDQKEWFFFCGLLFMCYVLFMVLICELSLIFSQSLPLLLVRCSSPGQCMLAQVLIQVGHSIRTPSPSTTPVNLNSGLLLPIWYFST